MCSFCAFADKDILTMQTAVLYRYQDPRTDILKGSDGIVCTMDATSALKSNFIKLKIRGRKGELKQEHPK